MAVAVDGARAAQRTWARTPMDVRERILLRYHDLVLERQVELLDLIQLESGKTRRQAFEEVADVALVSRHYARPAAGYLRPRRRAGLLPLATQHCRAPPSQRSRGGGLPVELPAHPGGQ